MAHNNASSNNTQRLADANISKPKQVTQIITFAKNLHAHQSQDSLAKNHIQTDVSKTPKSIIHLTLQKKEKENWKYGIDAALTVSPQNVKS